MTHSKIRATVVTERIAWIRQMLVSLKRLPQNSLDEFLSDHRNAASAESYLRRAIEALLDLGRHILAKGFGIPVSEYKEIAIKLRQENVISEADADVLRKMAGYRNRMVHFYQVISHEEIFDIVTRNLSDIEQVTDAITGWIQKHPDLIDKTI